MKGILREGKGYGGKELLTRRLNTFNTTEKECRIFLKF